MTSLSLLAWIADSNGGSEVNCVCCGYCHYNIPWFSVSSDINAYRLSGGLLHLLYYWCSHKQKVYYSCKCMYSLLQEWTLLDVSGGPKPSARTHHTACCLVGPLTGQEHPLLLVVGGIRRDHAALDDVWLLDIDGRRWKEVKRQSFHFMDLVKVVILPCSVCSYPKF